MTNHIQQKIFEKVSKIPMKLKYELYEENVPVAIHKYNKLIKKYNEKGISIEIVNKIDKVLNFLDSHIERKMFNNVFNYTYNFISLIYFLYHSEELSIKENIIKLYLDQFSNDMMNNDLTNPFRQSTGAKLYTSLQFERRHLALIEYFKEKSNKNLLNELPEQEMKKVKYGSAINIFKKQINECRSFDTKEKDELMNHCKKYFYDDCNLDKTSKTLTENKSLAFINWFKMFEAKKRQIDSKR